MLVGVSREFPDVLVVERAPLLESRPIAIFHQSGEIARVVGIGVGGEAPLRAHVTPEPGHPLERRWGHRIPTGSYRLRLKESAISSPMRARTSVLMGG